MNKNNIIDYHLDRIYLLEDYPLQDTANLGCKGTEI